MHRSARPARARSRALILLLACACLLLGSEQAWRGASVAPAHADWPLPRADVQRSGRAKGYGDLRAPVPYWRYFLGARLEPRQVRVLGHADGSETLLYVAGGALVAKRLDPAGADALRWESAGLGIDGIAAVADLDGRGEVEIVARARDGAVIVRAGDGAVLWRQPEGEMGTLGDLRIGDVDGDGLPELLAQECGCCRINSGNSGFVYGFGRGYEAAERRWTLPAIACGGTLAMALADVDGDGRAELVHGQDRRIAVLDGASGAVRALSQDLGEQVARSRCLPADIDARPGDELVCLQSNAALPADGNGHRVFALGFRPAEGPGEPATLALLWQRAVGEVPGQARFAAAPLADLDGDGTRELVLGGAVVQSSEIVPHSYVLDAATGALRAQLAGEHAVGTTAAPAPLLLTEAGAEAGDGDGLGAWRLDRGALRPQWRLPGRRALLEPAWELVARSSVAARVLTIADAAGGRALLTSSLEPGGELLAHALAAGSDDDADGPAQLGRFAPAPGSAVLSAWSADGGGILVATSDGRVHRLDGALASRGPSVRAGGYLPRGDWRNLHLTPVLGDVGAGVDEIFISDSRGALLRLDASDASLAVPPRLRWQLADSDGPVLLGQTPDGAYRELACRQRRDEGERVLVLSPEGVERWRVDLPGALLSDLVPLALAPTATDAGERSALLVQWGRADDVALRHRALDLGSGALLWEAEPQSPGTARFPPGGAVLDWDGDGSGDFVHQYYGTQVLSGTDGALLATGTEPGLVHFMPTVAELDGDPRPELLLHGGYAPVRAIDDDLRTPLWVSPEDQRPYPYGALVDTCADGVPRLAHAGLLAPATLSITPLAGAATGASDAAVLAAGKRFDSPAQAQAAGAFLGQLGSPVVHADLFGDGTPAVVVGSEDGHVYALDGCTGALAFAVPLGAAVGSIAFGDTDGDGVDELVAAAGDGYLYGLAQPPIAAPAWVADLAPESEPAASELADIDQLTQRAARDAVAASWAPVAGARGYRAAVVHADSGQVVSQPAWQELAADAGYARFPGLSLDAGERYRVAVRALAESGPSPDALSDGFLATAAPAPSPPVIEPPASGCGCRGARPGAAWPLGLLLLAVCLSLRRGRHRRGRGRGRAQSAG
ncbi:VCBS repeat-containing protein [Haliangium ochraceum]|uniref:FG-GAP repeat protein n=1 Tax=Haliangium ochraceum (strain DSM 14365 / JCM 11303 / SMP-2) TaxID=502025 RepID=D0LTY4_HALO1|nr:VCBS repeat-containing protein [Haliangium ochraceum]ACY15828.1 conserved hypothetical protein [Haliangium ochraceum DSM 14365]